MPNVSQFGAQTDNATVQGTVTDRAMVIPDIPPQGLMSVGPRVTPHFVKPSLWSALTTYHFFDAVHDAAGASYVATKPEVPAGTELTNEDYWFLWADPNSQFADLSELVKTFNGRITQNTEDIAANKADSDAKIEKLNEKTTEYLLNFGDSFSAPKGFIQPSWPQRAATKLHLESLNYAIAGAAYTQTTNSTLINEQVNKAIGELTDDQKKRVKYIVFYGGLNDALGEEDSSDRGTNFANTALNLANETKNNFPNSIVYLMDMNLIPWMADIRPKFTKAAFNTYMQRTSTNVIVLPASTCSYLPYNADILAAQETGHPSEKGLEALANFFCRAITSGALVQLTPYIAGKDNPAVSFAGQTPFFDGVRLWMKAYITCKDYTLTEPIQISQLYPTPDATMNLRALGREPEASGYSWDCAQLSSTAPNVIVYVDRKHNVWIKPRAESVQLSSSVAFDAIFNGVF